MSDGQSSDLRRQICEIGHRLYNRGYIGAGEGNISVRMGDTCLCTPTRISKGFLLPDQIALIDMDGKLLEGPLSPTSECPMHMAIYKGQPAAKAVIHAHPPYATALGVAGISLPKDMVAEAMMFLGPVPLLPYETPGTPELAARVRQGCTTAQAVMMKNHGALVWSNSLGDAWLLMEALEAVAKITWLTKSLGKMDPIPADKLAELPKFHLIEME